MNYYPLMLRTLLVAISVCCLSVLAEDWPRWRGPDLNGIAKERGWITDWPADGPKQLWKAGVGIGFSSVVVSNGRLYTMGNQNATDTVYCLNANTGAEVWKQSYPCPLDPKYYEGGPGATPTVDAGRVFSLSKRGQLFCFDADNGKVIWKKDLMQELGVTKPEWGFAGSPVVQGDVLFLNVGSAGTAVNKKDGKIKWSSGKGSAGYAAPVPFRDGNKAALLLFSMKSLVAVNPTNGSQLWSYPWETKWNINSADPIVSSDQIFLSSFDQGGAVLGVDGGNPVEVWHNKNMGNHFNSCVLFAGYLYGIHGNTDQPENALRCINFKTGEIMWSQEGLGLGSLMIADGKLIILSEKGELVIAEASPTLFKPLARAQVLGGKCWTTPVLANGRIYCRNAKGDLICLDVRPRTTALANPDSFIDNLRASR